MKPKRQQGAANHRDTRHENGLVGPGKRVQKQKSNGHLNNGHAKTPDSIPSTPLPATPPRPQLGTSNGHVRSPVDNSADHKMAVEASRRPSVSSYQESSSSESYQTTPTVTPENHHQINEINVNALKNPAVHRDNGPLSFALTVLRSCPLGDTIAILIVLLQLPPACLSIIHLLFATLTFVPPTSPANSAPSLTDIFEGTLGTPSVAVIVVIDAFVLLVWIMLWSPLQDILLDLAQSVIALTLGGGTSGRTGGMNNVLVCFGVIGVSHFARDDNMKSSSLGMLISSSGGFFGSPDPDDPLEAPTSGKKRSATAHGWIRSVLAIHILTQGVVRYIRDWYVRREKRDSTASAIGDPEAGNGALVAPNNDLPTPTIQSPENETPNPVAVPQTVVTSKKKRKQSAQVRLRQPLWAALASTKVVMVKEYETSHTAAESVGANATGINDLGNAPFDAEADQVWITYVGFDEVYFSTSYFPSYAPPENCGQKKNVEGIDKSKPFYVRVNNTTWQPTRINFQTEPGQLPGQDTRWSGEIFGLAPMSSYQCDFVSTVDGAVIFSTAVRTIKGPTADMAAAVTLSPNVRIQGRPNSPTTTLRTSIASSEAKLNEERNRQKRERKDQRAKLNAARKEIEKVVSSIASSGGNDDRLRQKVLQSKLHMKQAEDALSAVAAQIESLETIPTDDSSEWKYEKEAFYSQKELHKQSRQDFNHVKAAAERDIQALTNEVAALQQKRERMQSRIAKLNGEHERITDANAKGLDEAQRKARDREAKGLERANLEILYIQRSQALAEEIQTTDINCQATFAAINALQEAMYVAQSPSATLSNPQNPYDIPESHIHPPSSYPWNPQPPPFYPGTVIPLINQQGTRTRGRSSSMLSDISGFTQWDDAEPQPHLLSAEAPDFGFGGIGSEKERQRQKSEDTSSASGSGSGNGSAGDPKSPLTGKSAAFRWGVTRPDSWGTTVDEKP